MGIKDKIINFIKIKGITHQVKSEGVAEVEIKNNKVYVDNKEIASVVERELDIEWIGEGLCNLTISRGNLSCGDIAGSNFAEEGNVTCGDVGGDLEAGGNVTCKDVGGSVNTESGNIICGNVGDYACTEDGSIKAGNVGGYVTCCDLQCGNIGDSVEAGGKVTCGDISGNLTSEDGGEIICKKVGGDIYAETVKVG